jgi:hypothetical protein
MLFAQMASAEARPLGRSPLSVAAPDAWRFDPTVRNADTLPALVSANGRLVFNVSAQANPASGQPQFSYNGSPVAPTLRLLPGDTLVVNFTEWPRRKPRQGGRRRPPARQCDASAILAE